MVKAIFGLAVCAAVLTGCSQPAVMAFDGGAATPRIPPQCDIQVFVRMDSSVNKRRVVVDSDPVYPRGCPTNRVVWRVVGNYTFSNGAIAFGKNGGAVPGGSCNPGPSTPQGVTTYSCDFTLQPTGNFPYSITVQGQDGPFAADPSVFVD